MCASVGAGDALAFLSCTNYVGQDFSLRFCLVLVDPGPFTVYVHTHVPFLHPVLEILQNRRHAVLCDKRCRPLGRAVQQPQSCQGVHVVLDCALFVLGVIVVEQDPRGREPRRHSRVHAHRSRRISRLLLQGEVFTTCSRRALGMVPSSWHHIRVHLYKGS